MQESADPHAGHPGECENCDAVLQGEFCHRCGQSVHNPIRHAGHAVEEFFEAFWHLDGRVFRTLRDLLVPGRVACEYLAGHRQRYIAPMRLFVIFSVLTFFIGQLTLHVDSDPAQATAGGATTVLSTNSSFEDIDNSRTVEEVRRNRDRLLAAVEEGRDQTRFVPGLNTALVATKAQIRAAAAKRMAELSGQPPGAVDPVDPVEPDKASTASTTSAAEPEAASTQDGSADGQSNGFPGDWNPQTDPVELSWLPTFAHQWINRKLLHGKENVERMGGRTDLWLQAFLGSVPSALFLLVPVFALMLKLVYVFKRRLYLEHLVVALYSHVFLLMALTAMFLLSALGGWLEVRVPWLGSVAAFATALLWLWMLVYLLLMQKRVYGQGWPMTTLKYVGIGMVYIWLLAFATAIMFLATLVRT